ncbi:hypothetical protein [Streptomyces sp. NPDC001678]|uniref:hypothetical protein n=1 Tax=Streptomyces sp. NPDC001678 TaxID=3364599 RepID=UPI0036C7B485
MADDHRYDHDWLDDDAVERLLRGEFSAGLPAGGEAEAVVAMRLDAAFRSLTDLPSTGVPSTGLPLAGAASASVADVPLPGEEAALAAFREARAASATPVAPLAARGAGLRPVEALRSFLRRPARTALALALAGCAVGGVAVAAGTGVLPGPFGRSGKEPSPSASVTLADETDVATVAPGAPTPGATPAPGASARPGGRPDPSRTPGDKESGPASGSSASPSHGDEDDARDGKGDKGNKGDKPGKGDEAGTFDGAKVGHAWVAKACREFLAGDKRNGKGVDEDETRTLERFAGGSSAVRTYCERALASDGQGGPGGKGGQSGKGDEDGDGSVWDDLVNRAPRTRSMPRVSVPAPAATAGATPAATPGVTLFEASAL